MSDRSTAPLVWLVICATITILSPYTVQAQDDRWYRVELVVFSRPAAGGAEQWDATPELAYPGKSRFLTGDTSASEQMQTAPMTPLQPAPLITLPPSQQEFRGRADAMQRSGRYRILFHEAWTQPISSQSQSLPIVLDHSGDGGTWPALQGSVKIYVDRYLYVETNLWLNTQGEYLKGSWRMPAPPRGPSSILLEETMLNQIDAETPGQPLERLSEPTVQTEPGMTTTDQLNTESVYPFRHAVLLKQTRRMRSNETHYIDHPMLGVIVKISPLAETAQQNTAPSE
jgi:hypothetical protein